MNGQYGISVASTRSAGGSTGKGAINVTKVLDGETGAVEITTQFRAGDIITSIETYIDGNNWTPDTTPPELEYTLENVGVFTNALGVAELNDVGYNVEQTYAVVQNTGDALSVNINGTITTGTAYIIVNILRIP